MQTLKKNFDVEVKTRFNPFDLCANGKRRRPSKRAGTDGKLTDEARSWRRCEDASTRGEGVKCALQCRLGRQRGTALPVNPNHQQGTDHVQAKIGEVR